MLVGLFVCCVGVYGVFKLKYAANRMHAAALNDTLGVSFCLVGLAISAPDGFTALKILLVVVFLWLASPVASHLLCRLEVETNEERGQYMNVHEQSLAQEREEARARRRNRHDDCDADDAAVFDRVRDCRLPDAQSAHQRHHLYGLFDDYVDHLDHA